MKKEESRAGSYPAILEEHKLIYKIQGTKKTRRMKIEDNKIFNPSTRLRD